MGVYTDVDRGGSSERVGCTDGAAGGDVRRAGESCLK